MPDSERRDNCRLHAEKIDKMEERIDKIYLWMLGNGNPENGFVVKLNKVMDYMLDAKDRRKRTETFRRSIIIAIITLSIPAIVGFGYLKAEVEHNRTHITELRKI